MVSKLSEIFEHMDSNAYGQEYQNTSIIEISLFFFSHPQ